MRRLLPALLSLCLVLVLAACRQSPNQGIAAPGAWDSSSWDESSWQ